VAVCDMALPGRGVCQTCASNGGRRVAKRGEVGSFRLESSRVGVGKEALRRDMGRHGEVYGYGLYEERRRGMALVRDESKSGGCMCGRSGPQNCAGDAAIRHRWRRLEADGRVAHSLVLQPCRA
jgi:hypothetical protein